MAAARVGQSAMHGAFLSDARLGALPVPSPAEYQDFLFGARARAPAAVLVDSFKEVSGLPEASAQASSGDLLPDEDGDIVDEDLGDLDDEELPSDASTAPVPTKAWRSPLVPEGGGSQAADYDTLRPRPRRPPYFPQAQGPDWPVHGDQILSQKDLFGAHVRPDVPSRLSGAAHDFRMAEAGFHVDLAGPLSGLKTAVLVTGGMCSKFFGIGLMGYLAFQSMQASFAKQVEDEGQRQSYGDAED